MGTMMLSESSLKQISQLFCGDINGYYVKKTGPQLIGFFNEYYQAGDTYGRTFPTRWKYVYEKLVVLLNNNQFDGFLDIILSKEYLIREQGLSDVDAVVKINDIFDVLKQIVRTDLYNITTIDGHYHLVIENIDLVLIGSGGFANVYRQKSTGLVVKKLKDDFLADRGIRSRFKREYEITKSLQMLDGIIKVYDYDKDNCSYTMEYAEITFENYIEKNVLIEHEKTKYILEILQIMSKVHEVDIIHRDISPNNIFMVSGKLKIADFGLGKDLNVFSSHQTLFTHTLGQYFYCAPEQFMMLRDADKRSDVYSLGRLINYIMTKNPMDSHHIYRAVAEKATNSDAVYRYGDAKQLKTNFERSVAYHSQEDNQKRIDDKMTHRVFDSDVENYIYELGPKDISRNILKGKRGFNDAVFTFMGLSEEHAQHIIQSVEQSFRDVCGKSYEANDPFAIFSAKVLRERFPFVVKEIAATILRYVAWDVNRFSAQHIVESLLDEGIEPALEDIIRQ